MVPTRSTKIGIQVSKSNQNTTITRKAVNQTMPAKAPAKRPVWDLKGRLTDIEEAYKTATERFNNRVSELESENETLKANIESFQKQNDDLSKNVESLLSEKQKMDEHTQSIQSELDTKTSTVSHLETQIKEMRNECRDLNSNYNDMKSNFEDISQKLSKSEKECKNLNDELQSSEARLRMAKQSLDDKESEVRSLQKDSNDRKIEFIELMAKYEGVLKNYNDASFNYDREKNTNLDLTRKINELETKFNEKCSSFTDLKHEYDNLRNDRSELFRKLSDLDSKYGEKCHNYKELIDENEKVKNSKNELDKRFTELGSEFNSKCVSFDELVMNYQKLLSEKSDLVLRCQDLESKYQEKSKSYEELRQQFDSLLSNKEKLEFSLGDSQKRVVDIINDNKMLKEQVDRDAVTIRSLNATISQLSSNCDNLNKNLGLSGNQVHFLQSEMEKFKSQLARSDVERRLMHHKIMELRGTIRVCCRVRPVLPHEDNGNSYFIEYKTSDFSVVVSSAKDRETVTGSKVESKKYEFTFDAIFGADSSQKTVFEEIEPLIQSALDGYSVCIFAYGQTGSGKTYTMEGIPNDPERTGMIERAVEKIFNSMGPMSEKGWKYEVESSFLEIYNETIHDLLVKDSKNCLEKLDIKQKAPTKTEKNKKGVSNNIEIYIPNLTTVKVSSSYQVKNLLDVANRNRSVASTKCNEFSSRSHSVFTLKLLGSNEFLNEKTEAFVNLVDLAGSERLDQSGAEGERLKETQFINKSLSALKSVISSLCNKDSHVPYRDSKLTHLLRPSLGGNCKTLMFVNISPMEECFKESLNSLRFATNVNECYIGNATQNKTTSS
ncbi:Carboxy-terminal kinesin 2 [Thelohanellus kitauei]|uniref:Carboxy-terminal kinesin 2 n=1 Tax=Thelohanellus kitauei TaxID=669202 RepID=A0A0C2N7J4_THEKT|nr:Carboxy-terminal kinesin 2 [Thelohanellus kitauei]